MGGDDEGRLWLGSFLSAGRIFAFRNERGVTYLHLGTSAMLVEKFLWDWLACLSPLGLRVGAGGAGGGAHGLVGRFSCLALGASPAHLLHRKWSPRDLCGRAWGRGRTHPRLIPAGPSAK